MILQLGPTRSLITIGCLLAIHAFLVIGSVRSNSVTIDEFAHVPAGIAYWQHGSFFLYHHNPPLIKLLASLPIILSADVDVASIPAEPELASGQHWRVGAEFMRDNKSRYFQIMRWPRYPIVLLSLIGCVAVWHWARSLWGEAGGFLAMALWTISPDILAHAGLATVDLGAAVFGLIAGYAFWYWLRQPTSMRAIVAGALLGAAMLCKFTLLILPLTWLTVWAVSRAISFFFPPQMRAAVQPKAMSDDDERISEPHGWWRLRQLMREATQIMIGLAVAFVAVNAGYGFQQTGEPLGSFRFLSETLAGPLEHPEVVQQLGDQHLQLRRGNRFRDSSFKIFPIPLPAEFVRGFDEQLLHSETRERPGPFTFYLDGERNKQGWRYYYVVAMGFKTPLGMLGLLFTSVGATVLAHEYRRALADELALWLPPLALIAAVSLGTEINIGVRYILPAWPYLILATARLGQAYQFADRFMRLMVVCWGGWAVASVLLIHPHYLSYFNELAGGPANGWRYLADSNIDWGQDLLQLRRWLQQHPEVVQDTSDRGKPFYLAYAGTVDPHIAGFDYELPPSAVIKAGELETYGPRPGWFAVSVNFVVGLPFWCTDGSGQRRPTQEDEFGYFRLLEPLDNAGYSIFIYHVTMAQANAARKELGLPELPLSD